MKNYIKDNVIAHIGDDIVCNGKHYYNVTEGVLLSLGYELESQAEPAPYVPTEAEKAQQEIGELEAQLNATDYKAIKFAEGWFTAEEYAPVKAERQALRDRINELQKVVGA